MSSVDLDNSSDVKRVYTCTTGMILANHSLSRTGFLEVLYREPTIQSVASQFSKNIRSRNKFIRTNKLILYILPLHNEWTRCHPSDHLGLEQLSCSKVGQQRLCQLIIGISEWPCIPYTPCFGCSKVSRNVF